MGRFLPDPLNIRVGSGFSLKNPKRVRVLGIPGPNPTHTHIYIYINPKFLVWISYFLSNPNLTSLFASSSLFTLTQLHSHSHSNSQSQPLSQPNSSSSSMPHIAPLPYMPQLGYFPLSFIFLLFFGFVTLLLQKYLGFCIVNLCSCVCGWKLEK